MILRIAPQLVGDFVSTVPVEPVTSFAPAFRGWITRERSTPGHLGQPHHASPEKGETLFQVFADDVAAMIERVIAWDGHSWNS